MNTTKAFPRKLAAEWGEPGKPLSDYALAARIGVTKQQMSKYQSGEDYPGEEVAIRITDALDLDHGYVLACIAAERSKSEQAKKAWLSLTAALAIVTVGALGVSELVAVAGVPSLYIMSNAPAVTCFLAALALALIHWQHVQKIRN